MVDDLMKDLIHQGMQSVGVTVEGQLQSEGEYQPRLYSTQRL